MTTRPVQYMLRATVLPDSPSAVDEALLDFVRAARIDDVMFFLPHLEERSPGLGTVAECEAASARVAPLFARLRALGVAPSINIWWTVAFSDFPGAQRDRRKDFDFRWAVNAEGTESVSVACPQDDAWRRHVRWMYRHFAALKPARMWIDDDVRMTLRADMHCPCLCDVCRAEMARRTGRACTGTELVQAILADPPNPVRDAWLDFQDDLEVEIVRLLAEAIHAVSPETHVGLMHSNFEIHAAEGRRWHRLVEALGQPQPYFRPGIGPYVEVTGPGIAEAFNHTREMQPVLPPSVAIVPEIENYPHTRFMKSVATVRADMTLAQLMGLPGVTFSILRMNERLDLELPREPAWQRLLGEVKPYLQQIADLHIEAAQHRGVGLFQHEDAARQARGVAGMSRPIFTYRQRPWDVALPLLGIATRYGRSDITACSGEAIGALSDAELDDMLRGGVLLDARAAETLLRRGKGALAGITARRPDVDAVTEVITDATFGGLAGDIINLRWEGTPWQFAPAAGTREISRVRQYDGRDAGHGVLLCENALGGRVAIVPCDGQAHVSALGLGFTALASPTFLNWTRQAQLADVLAWLGRKPLELFVPGAPGVMPLLIDQGARRIVGVTNLHYDPIARLQLRLRDVPAGTVRALQPDATWTPLDAALRREHGVLEIDTGLRVGFLETAVLVVE